MWVARMWARRPRSLRFANGWFLLALGGAFGFISVVVAIAHESYWRLPGGVAANDYVTLGRRTVDTGRFERLSILDYEQIRTRVPEAEWAWARHTEPRRLRDDAGSSHDIRVREVSANYLAVLGVAAWRGQVTPAIIGDRAAVISHQLWQRLGGGDLVGTALQLEAFGGFPAAGDGLLPVVGVAAPAFTGLDGTPDLWILRSSAAKHEFGDDGQPNARVFGARGERLTTARLRELLTGHRFTTTVREVEGQVTRSRRYDVSANDRLEVVPGYLAQWASQQDVRALFLPTDDAAVTAFGRVASWVQARRQDNGSRFYRDAARSDFFSGGADPYLIAYALAHSHTVVTCEGKDAARRSKVLIPVVCDGLGVECISLFEMLRRAPARFILG